MCVFPFYNFLFVYLIHAAHFVSDAHVSLVMQSLKNRAEKCKMGYKVSCTTVNIFALPTLQGHKIQSLYMDFLWHVAWSPPQRYWSFIVYLNDRKKWRRNILAKTVFMSCFCCLFSQVVYAYLGAMCPMLLCVAERQQEEKCSNGHKKRNKTENVVHKMFYPEIQLSIWVLYFHISFMLILLFKPENAIVKCGLNCLAILSYFEETTRVRLHY